MWSAFGRRVDFLWFHQKKKDGRNDFPPDNVQLVCVGESCFPKSLGEEKLKNHAAPRLFVLSLCVHVNNAWTRALCEGFAVEHGAEMF